MYQIINWLCLICVSFLVLEVMVYICNDAINISISNKKINKRKIIKPSVQASSSVYTDKIAK